MAVNDLTFNQLATVLTSIVEQATGKKVITPTNTSEFVSVANTALLTGYDPLNTAISQVLGRTIFSIRPYNRKFKGLEVSNQRYGNHVRKVQLVDNEWMDDDRFKLADGQSVDQQIVNKPVALQTNFYGANVYQIMTTVYKDQLDNAFSSPDEFASFVSMQMQNVSDMMEQKHESMARMTLANLIGGVVDKYKGATSPQVVHLLTEYNTATGLSLDATTVKTPENYPAFVKWVYARVAAIAEMLTERSSIYHMNVTGKTINRHTPYDRMRVYLTAQNNFEINARVLADTFHDNYLKFADHESVNFWQSIEDPAKIEVVPTYMDATGQIITALSTVEVDNIFGVIMDEEAAGYTVVNQWSAPAAFNARGGYQNTFWHMTDRYWVDFSENSVILLLD